MGRHALEDLAVLHDALRRVAISDPKSVRRSEMPSHRDGWGYAVHLPGNDPLVYKTPRPIFAETEEFPSLDASGPISAIIHARRVTLEFLRDRISHPYSVNTPRGQLHICHNASTFVGKRGNRMVARAALNMLALHVPKGNGRASVHYLSTFNVRNPNLREYYTLLICEMQAGIAVVSSSVAAELGVGEPVERNRLMRLPRR